MKALKERPDETHLLLADYIRMKVAAGFFPKGSFLPQPQDFMRVFKLSFSTALKAMIDLEKSGVSVTFESGAKVVAGPEGEPQRLLVRRDVEDLFELLRLLELELLAEAWPRLDASALSSKMNAARSLSPLKRLKALRAAAFEEMARATENRALWQAQSQTLRQIDFLRALQHKDLSESVLANHVIELESIMTLICAGDFQGTRQRFSDYMAAIRDETIARFEEGTALSGRSASEEPGKDLQGV